MTPTLHHVTQGSDEWAALRCGVITASNMSLLLTPTLKIANNDKSRSHVFELLAQRVTGYTEPHFESFDMQRGHTDEVRAKALYAAQFAPVADVGFVENTRHGFKIGCSPDGLVGDDGMLQCKSRRQKFQVETILLQSIPDEYVLQIQTELLATERKWCDFVSYSGGLPMFVKRVYPEARYQDAILLTCADVETKLSTMRSTYDELAKLYPATERAEELPVV